MLNLTHAYVVGKFIDKNTLQSLGVVRPFLSKVCAIPTDNCQTELSERHDSANERYSLGKGGLQDTSNPVAHMTTSAGRTSPVASLSPLAVKDASGVLMTVVFGSCKNSKNPSSGVTRRQPAAKDGINSFRSFGSAILLSIRLCIACRRNRWKSCVLRRAILTLSPAH